MHVSSGSLGRTTGRLTLVPPLRQHFQHQIVVLPVREAHVERTETEDLDERLLDLPELVVDLVSGQGGHMWVGPLRQRGEGVSC
jgi:hypothetical protein